MKKLFNEDSLLMRGLNRLVDLIILNVLWIVFSLPVITFGAATTAVQYIVLQYAKGNDLGVIKPFLKQFRSNFLKSTLIWLIMLLWATIAGADLYMVLFGVIAPGKTMQIFILAVSSILAICWLITVFWVFALQSRFDNTVKNTLRNAFLVGVFNFPRTLLCAAAAAACLWITMALPEVFPFWMFLGYALAACLLARVKHPVLQKLEDRQEPEDRAE